MRVSVVGLGKLGASMAGAIASRGHTVVGVDRDERAVRLLNDGRSPVSEPGLAERIADSGARIRGTTSVAEAVAATDLTFVVVPTPSDAEGAFRLDAVADAFERIGAALRDHSSWHTVVLTSTVLPGSTRYGLLPILERAAGRSCGDGFGLCYSPAFIALGSVVHDFLNPDFVLIGEHDAASGDALLAAYAGVLENSPAVRRMSIENAELTKLAVNTYVTTKVTFANMLADLCERLPGGDVDVVSDALGLDRRIGRRYLTGALGYGGPCFPRDNQALNFLARSLGGRARLAEATDASNRAITSAVVERVRSVAEAGARVAVLGLAYKPATPVVEEAAGMLLARALSEAGYRVLAHDPLARDTARAALPPEVTIVDTVDDALSEADVVLITTPDPQYAALSPTRFNGKPRPVVVFDFWRILRGSLAEQPNIRYHATGVSPDDGANERRLAALWGANGG